MPIELPKADLPPLEPRDRPIPAIQINAVMMPTKVIYAIYVALGCCLITIVAQGIVMSILAKRLGIW